MSDKVFPSEVELRDALEQLINRGPARCPMCSNTSWVLETEPITEGFALPLAGLIGFRALKQTNLSPLIPCLVLTCEDCGFIRTHSIPTLLAKSRKSDV